MVGELEKQCVGPQVIYDKKRGGKAGALQRKKGSQTINP